MWKGVYAEPYQVDDSGITSCPVGSVQGSPMDLLPFPFDLLLCSHSVSQCGWMERIRHLKYPRVSQRENLLIRKSSREISTTHRGDAFYLGVSLRGSCGRLPDIVFNGVRMAIEQQEKSRIQIEPVPWGRDSRGTGTRKAKHSHVCC